MRININSSLDKYISVLMPAFNTEKYIGSAIKSILNQSYPYFELLIIDDGSTDSTEFVVNSFDDTRIRFIKKEHSGLSETLNFGLSKANFDLIARMDSDDISLPSRFERQINYIANRENVILSNRYAAFSNQRLLYIVNTPLSDNDIRRQLSLYSPICHASVMFSKSLVLSVGGYRCEVFEDYDLWLRLKDRVEFCNLHDILLLERIRKNSLSRERIAEKLKIHYKIQKPYYEDLTSNFPLTNTQAEIIRGKREFYFGNIKVARKIFFSIIIHRKKIIGVLFFFLMTYIPHRLYLRLRGKAFSRKTQFRLMSFWGENNNIKKLLNDFLATKK